uniref:RRM domain-containing protein n=1 Tax=Mola mola TaxID=94237 RepID=A0A3Q3W9V0_MOLML
DRKPLSNKTLFAFSEPFGCLREHLVLKNKAFLEMSSHEEAVDMVNYYKQNPASLYGKPISFYLSKTLLVIERFLSRPQKDEEVKGQRSQVVFFSNLPREDEKKKELLTIARRFGVVEKHIFLTDQLGTPEDAEMLVKYYSMNPLTIKGRLIRLNICTKYKTLETTSSSKSSSSSRSREERREEEEKEEEEEEKEKPKSEDKPSGEEEEEVSGVMDGEDGVEEEDEGKEEQAAEGDAEGREPEGALSVEETAEESKDVPQEEVRTWKQWMIKIQLFFFLNDKK